MYCPGTLLEILNKTTNISVWIGGVMAEIRNQSLVHTRQDGYSCAKLLRESAAL
jgi:hypothetical protein